jgi:hypothetical protein
MQFILTSNRPRALEDTAERIESVRFTDDGIGWTHRYGGFSDGIRLELLDQDGNLKADVTVRMADILAMAQALTK